jgi:predicted O-methyltransferase YrrM
VIEGKAPWLAPWQVERLAEMQGCVLEVGCGWSTLVLAECASRLVCVETDWQWADRVLREMSRPEVCEMVWVTPRHVVKALREMKAESFDVIFLDGVERVACAREAVRLLKPDGRLWLHDFERPEYAEILEWFEVVEDLPGDWKLPAKLGILRKKQ